MSMNQQSNDLPDKESAEAKLIGYTGGYVALPFDQEQFRDFVVSLLGRPQTIEKRIYGRFEVGLQDIQNFYYLIDQRLTQQNNALLVQFRAKIYFSDDSSIVLNSFDDLVAYNEVRPLLSVAIDLSWDYLIQFNDKKYPEKQGIDVRIWTAEAAYRRARRRQDEVVIVGSSESRSFFNLTIRHTARSWGMDIEALLTSHIQSLVIPNSIIKSFIKEHSGWIGAISGLSFFLGSVVGVFWATENFVQSRLERIDLSLGAEEDLSSKIAIVAEYLVSGESARHYLLVGIFLLGALIASIVVGGVIGAQVNSDEPSFLLLTQGAKRNQQKQLKRMSNHWRNLALSIVISLMTNVMASYIFVYLTR